MNYKTTQDALLLLERLAALCATEGVDENTRKMANTRMQELLDSVLKTAVVELRSSGVGIVTMNDV